MNRRETYTKRQFLEKWARRAISVPMVFLFFFLLLLISPVAVPIIIVVDIFRWRKFAVLRSYLFALLWCGSESLGVFLLTLGWIFTGFGLIKKPLYRWTFLVQRWWGGWLFNGTVRIFGIHFEIEEPEDVHLGPLMLFFRHAAMPDTSLPGALFVLRHKMKIRHIIKRELLWDPSLDIGGNIVPNFFVRRGAGNNTAELESISRLASDMQQDEGILIFPEGTRFTPKKRNRILEKLKEKGDFQLLEKAKKLRHTLPPRLAGSLAILEANTRARFKAAAVFCAHTGFEAANKAVNLMNGSLVNATVKIKMWKVPFENIPKTREAQAEWLYEQWARIDEWVGEHKQHYATPSPAEDPCSSL